MKIEKVSNRGLLFTFDELNIAPYNCKTNVYVIIGKNDYYICDTYLGPYFMKKIKHHLELNYGLKNYIVFNSHSHWDHIWGNCEFKESKIIAHEKCREFLLDSGLEDLELLKNQFAKEDIEIILPNITFSTVIKFEDDELEFFYSPGHSEDSASCFDHREKTLFVGDNIDDPIPSFMCWWNLAAYRETLKKYELFNAERVVQSHGPIISPDVILQNIEYLDILIKGDPIKFERIEVEEKHQNNIHFLKGCK